MITTPEQEENIAARSLLLEHRVETGDDPRSYAEIARSLGLLSLDNAIQEAPPETETTL